MPKETKEQFYKKFQKRILSQVEENKLIIFFNRGGWGDADINKGTLEKNFLEGIQKFFTDRNVKFITFDCPRIRGSGFWKKIKHLYEIVFGYPNESKELAKIIESTVSRFNGVKVLLIGYSMGGEFSTAVMKRIREVKRVYSIQAGTPFIFKDHNLKNNIFIQSARDALSYGKKLKLLYIFFLGVIKIMILKERSFAQAVHNPWHEYRWEDEAVRKPSEAFLEKLLND